MDFSEVKLVVCDIDGTLLNSQHTLSEAFMPLFKAMRKKDIEFVAASGRQYFNLLQVFPDIKDDMYFIADNGSYAVYKNNDLLVRAMEPSIVIEQLEVARKIPNSYPILCGKKKAYIEDEAPEFIENVVKFYSEREVVSDLLAVTGDDFLKIAICDLAGVPDNSYPHFEHLKNQLQVKISGELWLDLSHQQANKGEALKHVQQKLGVQPHQTMVFGDYLNDLEMMQYADFSYAMDNAHPEIKAAANYTTASNDEDGVIKILQQIV